MAKKPKVEVDEGLVRQVIAGQLPLTTKVTREMKILRSKSRRQNRMSLPGIPEKKHKIVPAPAPEPRRRRTMVIPISSRPI